MPAYPRMKDSSVEWIGETPTGWGIAKIASLYSLRNDRVSDKEYPPLSVTMHGILPQLETAARTDDGDNRRLVRVGDFVINSRSDRRGSCGISPYDGSISLINTVMTPRGKMNAGYYNWLFHTSQFADEFYKWGHGIVDDLWATRWQEMKKILVPVPQLPEQERIRGYLDSTCADMDTAIAEAKGSVEEYKLLRQSVITQAVTKGLDPNAPMKDSDVDVIGEMPCGWELGRQRFLCKTMTGDQDTQDSIEDGEYPFYVRSPIVQRSHSYSYDGEGVLMAGDGAGAGRVFHYAQGKYAIHQRVYCFHDFADINPRFFFHYMSAIFPFEMDKGSAKSTVPSVRLPMLLNFRIPLPTMSEQGGIVSYLDPACHDIDSLISEKQSMISDLESYKKSLIYEVVTGKRRVA